MSKKVDINITKILPKLLNIALNSPERDLKVNSCELLHGIIIFMIGKSA